MTNDDGKRTIRDWLAATNWVALILVVLVVVFMAQNADETTLTLLWATVRWPLWLAIGVVFALSFAAGYLVRMRRDRRTRRSRR